MLREMARVLKPGGVASFLTITYPPDLTLSQRERAVELGSEEGLAGPGYPALMTEAGFVDVSIEDVTVLYRDTLEALIGAWREESEGIKALIGEDDFDERMQRRENSLRAVDEGLHVRLWVTGRIPH